LVSLEAKELGIREAAMAIFEGPSRNRNIIIAVVVVVVIAVIIYFYAGGRVPGV
jgi:capsular polysaccharide biosynthesis protein